MNTWMVRKNLTKHHFLKKKRFLQSPQHGRYYWCRLYAQTKRLPRFWNKKMTWISLIYMFKAIHYCLLMYLKTLQICVLKYIDLARFLIAPWSAWQASLRKTKVKLDLLTRIDMFLMVKKCIKCIICHAIYWYVWKIIKINILHSLNIGM